MANALAKRHFSPIADDQYLDISERVCPMRYEISERRATAGRSLLGCRIGAVSLVHYESCGVERGMRTIEHIRAQPLDDFILCLPLQARFQFHHVGLRTDISAGSAVLLSAQRPFDAYISGLSEAAWHSSMQVRIPGPLLRSRLQQIDQLCNQPIPVLSGAGMIMKMLLQASIQEANAFSESQALHQSHVLADVIANSLREVGGTRVVSVGEPPSALSVFDRAMSYIECQLSSGDVDASKIASHCRVSVRYLHKIFAQRGLTVAATVREMRLVQCQEALRDERLAHRTVIDIACDWGFSDPSHFGRLYKKRFGRSPSQERCRPQQRRVSEPMRRSSSSQALTA